MTCTVSAALGAYNGMQYIQEQILSILPQLKDRDELVVSVNPSKDGTEEYLKALAEKDQRVKVFFCAEKGIIANFENAIRHCSNDIIYLCDQDDVWRSEKGERVKDCVTDGVVLVENSCLYIEGNLHET